MCPTEPLRSGRGRSKAASGDLDGAWGRARLQAPRRPALKGD